MLQPQLFPLPNKTFPSGFVKVECIHMTKGVEQHVTGTDGDSCDGDDYGGDGGEGDDSGAGGGSPPPWHRRRPWLELTWNRGSD